MSKVNMRFLFGHTASLCLYSAIAVILPVKSASATEGTLLYTSDSGFLFALSEKATAKEIYAWVDRQKDDAGVDIYAQMVFHQGWVELFQSEFAEHDTRKKYKRLESLFAQGIQPLNLFIERTHHKGMKFVAAIRMNDRHGHNKKFLDAHPDWLLEEFPFGVDFSIREVREWMFNIMNEIVQKFDVDGLDLDFMRSGHMFPRETARESHAKMTDLLRQVKTMLDATSKLKSKELSLGVRVPQTLHECRLLGLDVPTWIKEGLIDSITPSDDYFTDFNAPYEEFGELIKGTGIKMYPSIHPPVAEGYRQLNHTHMSRAMYRAAVKNFYMAGAHGVSVYNYHYAWRAGWNPPRARYVMKWLREFKYPQKLETGDRHYAFYPLRSSPVNIRWETGYRPRAAITLDRIKTVSTGTLDLRIAEDLDPGITALMSFNAKHLGRNDRIKVELNGTEIPTAKIKRVYVSEGRKAGIHYPPMGPHSRCDFALTSPPAVRGKNTIKVTWLGPTATGDRPAVVIPEFDVLVQGVSEHLR